MLPCVLKFSSPFTAKPIRAGQGHVVTGIRGGGGIGPQKIISDESIKRNSMLKGNSLIKFVEKTVVSHGFDKLLGSQKISSESETSPLLDKKE